MKPRFHTILKLLGLLSFAGVVAVVPNPSAADHDRDGPVVIYRDVPHHRFKHHRHHGPPVVVLREYPAPYVVERYVSPPIYEYYAPAYPSGSINFNLSVPFRF
jgi:hypothetical protein